MEALSIKLKTETFPRPHFSVVPSIANLQLILIIAWAFMIIGLTTLSQPVQGASSTPEAYPLPPNGTVNFEEGVRIALHQSPFFTKSSLEIDVRRLTETDSRYDLFPSIDFRSYYYINRPQGITSPPYSLNFSTDPNYNPIASYFALQAAKLATQAAILTHLKSISAGLERLGQLFIDLEFIKNQTLITNDQIKLYREILAYWENGLSAGTATSLEVMEAQQKLKEVQLELDDMALKKKRALANLKSFLGLRPTQELTPDLQNTRRQVLGNFDPALVTWEQAKSRSYDLKLAEVTIKLQAYNVKLAKVKVLPTILFTTLTPDPLSTTQTGLYAGFGLYVPLWDGFKRIRNVTRQKTVQKQFVSDKTQAEIELEDKFQSAKDKVMETSIILHQVQSQIEILQLKSRQVEAAYQSGEVKLPGVLGSRDWILKAKKQILKITLEHDLAVLAFRQISGDLGYTYVDASSWQK